MWIIPKSSEFYHFVPATGMLVLSMRIFRSMFAFANQFKVRKNIMGLIKIFVMHIKACRNGAITCFPYISVQKTAMVVCACIVPICSPSIFLSGKHNKGQRAGSFSHHTASPHKAKIYRLAAYSESLADLGEAIALMIKSIHFLCSFNVWFTTHNRPFVNNRILMERLAGVNR